MHDRMYRTRNLHREFCLRTCRVIDSMLKQFLLESITANIVYY